MTPGVWNHLVISVDHCIDNNKKLTGQTTGSPKQHDGDTKSTVIDVAAATGVPVPHATYSIRAALNGQWLVVKEHCRYSAKNFRPLIVGEEGNNNGNIINNKIDTHNSTAAARQGLVSAQGLESHHRSLERSSSSDDSGESKSKVFDHHVDADDGIRKGAVIPHGHVAPVVAGSGLAGLLHQTVPLSPQRAIVGTATTVSRENSFGFFDPLTRSCFQGHLRGFSVFTSPHRLLPAPGVHTISAADPTKKLRSFPSLRSIRYTDNNTSSHSNLPSAPSQISQSNAMVLNVDGETRAMPGARFRASKRVAGTTRFQRLWRQAAAKMSLEETAIKTGGGDGSGLDMSAAASMFPFFPTTGGSHLSFSSSRRHKAAAHKSKHKEVRLGLLNNPHAVFAVLHALPLNTILLTNHCGHNGQYKGHLVNKWSCCDSTDPNSPGCGEYHPGYPHNTTTNTLSTHSPTTDHSIHHQ